MAMAERSTRSTNEHFEYVRPIRPRYFPEEAKVPESVRHFECRTALYQLLAFFLRGRAVVGSDQFMYYDASDPKVCLAPDVYVKLGSTDRDITSWKTWERGTPELVMRKLRKALTDALDATQLAHKFKIILVIGFLLVGAALVIELGKCPPIKKGEDQKCLTTASQ